MASSERRLALRASRIRLGARGGTRALSTKGNAHNTLDVLGRLRLWAFCERTDGTDDQVTCRRNQSLRGPWPCVSDLPSFTTGTAGSLRPLVVGRSSSQDFHFGPGTATVYTRAAPNITSFRAEPCTSPPPVGARARPSAHRRCLSGLNGAPADNAPCETFLEPKTVDPHPGNATHPAQAAPRSSAACRQTAAGSDTPRPAAASNTARA